MLGWAGGGGPLVVPVTADVGLNLDGAKSLLGSVYTNTSPPHTH